MLKVDWCYFSSSSFPCQLDLLWNLRSWCTESSIFCLECVEFVKFCGVLSCSDVEFAWCQFRFSANWSFEDVSQEVRLCRGSIFCHHESVEFVWFFWLLRLRLLLCWRNCRPGVARIFLKKEFESGGRWRRIEEAAGTLEALLVVA